MGADHGSLSQFLMNAVTRRVSNLFPGYFEGAKHNHYADFSYPQRVTFDLLLHMYQRNALARGAVQKTADKIWQSTPALLEGEESHDETETERMVRRHIAAIRGWQMMKAANTRAMVGGWSGLILRIEDGQTFEAPVDYSKGRDITWLAGLIPAWSEQLQVTEWDDDPMSPTYGAPKMYQFNEAAVSADDANRQARQVKVHPDRVVIWSPDGLPYGTSLLQAGYNDLLDIEKVNGAGGEAFWKNSKGGAVLKLDKDVKVDQLLRDMGAASTSELVESMNTQLEDFAKGLDKVLMLAGMEFSNPQVSLPSPEFFRLGPLQNFAASVSIPTKILIGMQSGERASTEDANEWAQTCMARRAELTHPSILDFANRLERFGILPEADWFVHQDDLTEATVSQKIANAKDMAEINAKAAEPIFTDDDIRDAAGYEPFTEQQRRDLTDEGIDGGVL